MWGCVSLEIVNDEFVGFLVIKPGILGHPVGSVCEHKMKLGGREPNRKVKALGCCTPVLRYMQWHAV